MEEKNIDGKMVEQVKEFNYFGVKIVSSGNVATEIKTQVQKAARVTGCLNELVWKNKYMRKETKSDMDKKKVQRHKKKQTNFGSK